MNYIYFIEGIIFLTFVILSFRFSWWRKDIAYSYPRVLMYHMISEHLEKDKSKFNRLRVKPQEFEKQLKWLKENNWNSYTLSELENLNEIPEKAVVITFDDGYEDNFKNAFPLLKKYNFKATIYIVLNRFNQNWATDKDLNQSSNELNSEKMLSNEQIKEMINSGLIEIGSHTLDHVNLPKLIKEEKEKQIFESKKQIEEIFNIKCTSFAYPFGFFDNEDLKILNNSSYTNATTVVNGVYDKTKFSSYLIPRIMISGRQNMFSFILKMKKGQSR
ncbi:polysaccharide deacetylase family protein [Arcobacter caeni]|uniref:Polysaccharide deacetylase n=1 Tax=Arcobacter caeni TaxID=1912877 RepID=A0A363CWY3_9BACT|nr:polysaccharide deacetylase family protein [Arcobacter caeni]PUE63610.1 polysaccharide deacetylase [Arcobacter caeni]